MERDLDLCRKILQVIESCSNPFGLLENPKIEGYSPEKISYHLEILLEAGLIKAIKREELPSKYNKFFDINLTWEAHEFLSLTKENTLWEKAKNILINSGKSFTFNLLLDFLSALAKKKLTL